jgi:hypothetical protein
MECPKMMLRRHSSGTSVSSSASSKGKGKKVEAGAKLSESQESQESGKSQFSRSGISDTFFEALNFSDDEADTPAPGAATSVLVPGTMALSETSELAQSIGIVCTMSRRSTNKRQKDIKPFALQKTFYAFPKSITEEQKEKMKARIEKDIADFKFQKYTVTIHRFGLPFPVEEVCCVSEGYNLTPKILKAVLPPPPATSTPEKKKRKRKPKSEDDESDHFDVEEAYDELWVEQAIQKYVIPSGGSKPDQPAQPAKAAKEAQPVKPAKQAKTAKVAK